MARIPGPWSHFWRPLEGGISEKTFKMTLKGKYLTSESLFCLLNRHSGSGGVPVFFEEKMGTFGDRLRSVGSGNFWRDQLKEIGEGFFWV